MGNREKCREAQGHGVIRRTRLLTRRTIKRRMMSKNGSTPFLTHDNGAMFGGLTSGDEEALDSKYAWGKSF